MNFFSSQNTKSFNVIEDIREKKRSRHKSDNFPSLDSNLISLFRLAYFLRESKSPYPAEQVPIICLHPSSTEDF